MLVVLLIPFAEADGAVGSGQDPGAEVAMKSGRADEMPAWSVDSGGGEASGGDFSIIAAIGQPDVGLVSNGGTNIDGGLWAGSVDLQSIFCDGFETGDTSAWTAAVGTSP